MTAFDNARQCLVVRIVYDGPALAGKTTNLRQICDTFPVERRSELFTPGALRGRTMFFDWLEIDGGQKGGTSYRFQLLTVPGQVQRNYRRRPLLQIADAVVFVCDCSPDALDETRRAFRQLKTHLRRRKPERVPLVVQANKQDTPGAIPLEEMARLLRLDPSVPLLPAVASSGDGVRETIRAAAAEAMKELERQWIEQGGIALEESLFGAEELFNAMLQLEDTGIEEAPDEEDTDALEGVTA